MPNTLSLSILLSTKEDATTSRTRKLGGPTTILGRSQTDPENATPGHLPPVVLPLPQGVAISSEGFNPFRKITSVGNLISHP